MTRFAVRADSDGNPAPVLSNFKPGLPISSSSSISRPSNASTRDKARTTTPQPQHSASPVATPRARVAFCSTTLPSCPSADSTLLRAKPDNGVNISVVFAELCRKIPNLTLPKAVNSIHKQASDSAAFESFINSLSRFPPTGFINQDATACFINAAMQALMTCQEFLACIVSAFTAALCSHVINKTFAPFVFAFISLMTNAANNKTMGSRSPIDVLSHFPLPLLKELALNSGYLAEFVKRIDERGQQDAQEFLLALLTMVSKANPAVGDLFSIQEKSSLEVCPCGSDPGRNHDTHNHLILNLKSGNPGSPPTSLQALLSTTLNETETVEMKCDMCGETTKRQKTTKWIVHSRYFVIARSAPYDEVTERTELRKIDFDTTITVDSQTYRLLAEVVYAGRSAMHGSSGGHYYCIRHTDRKSMIKLDDESVRKLQSKPIQGPELGTVIAVYEKNA